MGTAGGKGKTGRNLLETKIQGQMDAGWGKNTNFFHNLVIQDRNNSRIQKLKKMDGSRIETCREIEEELTHYFVEILNKDILDRERDFA